MDPCRGALLQQTDQAVLPARQRAGVACECLRAPVVQMAVSLPPTAIARLPKEFLPHPPRSRIERSFPNVQRWSEFERGGHFPALEQPEALAADLVAFFGTLG